MVMFALIKKKIPPAPVCSHGCWIKKNPTVNGSTNREYDLNINVK